MDPHEAGAVLEQFAVMELLAGLRVWGGEFQPGEDLVVTIRDLAARLRRAQGEVANRFTAEDAMLLERLTSQIRSDNELLVTDKRASNEMRRHGAQLLGVADQLESCAQWVRSGLEDRPTA